jgi:hypothetical protein
MLLLSTYQNNTTPPSQHRVIILTVQREWERDRERERERERENKSERERE